MRKILWSDGKGKFCASDSGFPEGYVEPRKKEKSLRHWRKKRKTAKARNCGLAEKGCMRNNVTWLIPLLSGESNGRKGGGNHFLLSGSGGGGGAT